MKVRVGKIVTGFTPTISSEWVKKFLQASRSAIYFRIEDGVTVDGEPMLTGGGPHGTTARYSEQYERWKGGKVKPRIKSRRKRKTRLPPQGRDIYSPGDRFVLTGDMLRAWRVVDWTTIRGKLGFTSLKEALKAIGNHLLRPTFCLSKQEVDEILAEILREYGFG